MLDDRPSWQAHALCNTGDASLVDVFFGRGRRDFDGERAKQICAACPVRVPCLDYALDHIDATSSEFTPTAHDSGVWGGLTGHERAELRKEGAA
jgi:WhiB family redox-sensing transcriptional regulator